jgi:uncharacterized protein (DUF3820 family)
MFDKIQLLELNTYEMPFGKYSGRAIIDLPEEYLLWFQKKGWPPGKLGELMMLAMEIRLNGLEGMVRQLR